MPILMKARFKGTCTACQKTITKGQAILWDRPNAYHEGCKAQEVATLRKETLENERTAYLERMDRLTMYGGQEDFY